jgi:hypothetical protein
VRIREHHFWEDLHMQNITTLPQEKPCSHASQESELSPDLTLFVQGSFQPMVSRTCIMSSSRKGGEKTIHTLQPAWHSLSFCLTPCKIEPNKMMSAGSLVHNNFFM